MITKLKLTVTWKSFIIFLSQISQICYCPGICYLLSKDNVWPWIQASEGSTDWKDLSRQKLGKGNELTYTFIMWGGTVLAPFFFKFLPSNCIWANVVYLWIIRNIKASIIEWQQSTLELDSWVRISAPLLLFTWFGASYQTILCVGFLSHIMGDKYYLVHWEIARVKWHREMPVTFSTIGKGMISHTLNKVTQNKPNTLVIFLKTPMKSKWIKKKKKLYYIKRNISTHYEQSPTPGRSQGVKDTAPNVGIR